MDSLGESIQSRRNQLNISKEDLAKMLNVTSQKVSAWESGKEVPDAFYIPAIASILQLDSNYLFTRKIAKEKELQDLIDYDKIYNYKIFLFLSSLLLIAVLVIIALAISLDTSINSPQLLIAYILLGIVSFIFFAVGRFSYRRFYIVKKDNQIYKENDYIYVSIYSSAWGFVLASLSLMLIIFKIVSPVWPSFIVLYFSLLIIISVPAFFVKKLNIKRKNDVAQHILIAVFSIVLISSALFLIGMNDLFVIISSFLIMISDIISIIITTRIYKEEDK